MTTVSRITRAHSFPTIEYKCEGCDEIHRNAVCSICDMHLAMPDHGYPMFGNCYPCTPRSVEY